MAENVAKRESAIVLYFRSIMFNVNGKRNNKAPTNLFMVVCNVMNLLRTINP